MIGEAVDGGAREHDALSVGRPRGNTSSLPAVRSFPSVPSTRTVAMVLEPPSPVEKTMRVPSGDQPGSRSSVSLVTAWGVAPFTGAITLDPVSSRERDEIAER